ncbi:right-handed parallel beta-helix repeat-containing protein [Xanthobacter flavus]|nr:right-handed parallel beta-helix repeat-containing protein [Xanthobacter flavus]
MSLLLPITSSARVSGPYTAGAGQKVFTFGFPVQRAEDVRVEWRATADDDWAALLLGTHYVVSGVGEPAGGSIAFFEARPTGSQILVLGRAAISAEVDALPANSIDSFALNRVLDRITMWVQELRRDVGTVQVEDAIEAAETAKFWALEAAGVGAPFLSITRADISSRIIPLASFVVAGLTSVGDLGHGAVYVAGGSGGPMAIQDAAGTWFQLATIARTVEPGHWGVRATGATDDTAALFTAWAFARANGYNIKLPNGTIVVASITAPLELETGMTVYGTGFGSIIKWIDTPSSPPMLIGRHWASSAVSDVTLRDFQVVGSHGDAGDYTSGNHYPILVYHADGVRITGVKVQKSRVFGITCRDCNKVEISGCVVRYGARDGINTADCNVVRITNNVVEFIDDDAIASHTSGTGNPDRQVVIANNTVRFAQGIKVLGAVSCSITGNVLEYCMAQGISVESTPISAGSEGRNASLSLVITGNLLNNIFDRAAVDGLSGSGRYLSIGADANQAGPLAAVPGENVTAGGTVISPFPYFANSANDSPTEAVPGSYAWVIADNVFMRDVPTGVSLSSLGRGTFYTRNGPVDIASISAAAVRRPGIWFLGGSEKGVSISGNVFMGIGNAIELADGAKLRDAVIAGNVGLDITSAIGISTGNGNGHGITCRGNLWDLDPFHAHANRAANGKWTATGSPVAYLIQNASGVSAQGDTFRNCCRISDYATAAAGGTTDRAEFIDCVIEAQPAALGFDTGNAGVGELPRAGPAFRYRIVDCDPASATWGNVISTCKVQATAIPTSGTYVAGAFVENANKAVAGGKVLMGWVRLTTGFAHVSGTDWSPVYCTVS